jgi:hypothetical protein
MNKNYNYVWRCVKLPNARKRSKKGCEMYQYSTARANPLLNTDRVKKKCWYCNKKTTLDIKGGSLIPMLFDTRLQAKKWADKMNPVKEAKEVKKKEVKILSEGDKHYNKTDKSKMDKIRASFARANKCQEGWALKQDIVDLAFVYENIATATFYRIWKKMTEEFDVKKDGRFVYVRVKQEDWPVAEKEQVVIDEAEDIFALKQSVLHTAQENKKLKAANTALKATNEKLTDANKDLLNKASTQNDENTMLLLNNNRVLESRLNEFKGLINHYELTIALLIGRLKDEQKALSSHATTEAHAHAGEIVGQTKQNR